MAGIFISYRREDSSKAAERIYSALTKYFKEELVFIDVSSTPDAADFRKVIEGRLIECDVLIAVIGNKWLAATDKSGRPRIELRSDFVRREITIALSRSIQVIPVLVDEAQMPSAEQVPRSLRNLTFRQALQIGEGNFDEGVQRLGKTVEQLVARTESIEAEIARRAYYLKLFDLIPKPVSVVIKKIGIDRRFLTTVATLILKPSQLKLLHVRFFSRPLEFLSACVAINVLVVTLYYALRTGEIDLGRLIARWLEGYFWLLIPSLVIVVIETVTPFLVRKNTAPPITFKTRFKYYCFIVGWLCIIDTMQVMLSVGITFFSI